MENELYRIRKVIESVCRLMETLVALQRENRQCSRTVSRPGETDTADQKPQEPAETVSGKLYNRKEAADYLLVHPRTVTRYRVEEKLHFIYDGAGNIRYREPDLEDCYFWKWGRRP